jgi:hypothetical protein
MIIKAPDDIGGSYHSYAPGHGGLAFVHVDHKGNATNERVPREVAEQLIPEGWALTDINGRLEAYRVYLRVANNVLMDSENHKYMYELRDDGYEFWMFAGLDWESVRNSARKLSLNWFLTHEHLLSPAASDQKKAPKEHGKQ